MTLQRISKNELEIMEVLWREQRPLASSEIVELSQVTTWKKSSIFTLMNALLEKGYVEVSGTVKINNKYPRTFVPTLSFEEYTVQQIQNNKSFTVQSIPKIVAALINIHEATESNDELIKELQDIIREETNKKKQ